MAQGHLLLDQPVGLGPLASLKQVRLDRLPPRWQLIDLAHIQIAMQRQRQGSGNGRGRHREEMGLETLRQKTVALAHTKAVLLIHHHQAQAVKLHRIFQQGMGTHQHLELAVDQVLQQLTSPRSRG